MYPKIKECLNDFIAALEPYAHRKDDIDVKIMYGNYTMDVIASCAFATKTNSNEDPNSPFVLNARKVFASNKLKLLSLTLLPSILLKLFNIKHMADESANQFFFSIIRHIMKERDNNHKKYNDFIELLMNAKKSTVNDNNNKDITHYEEEDVSEAHHIYDGMN